MWERPVWEVALRRSPRPQHRDSPLPFARGFDHTYDIMRLEYKFRCNADPDGRVVYDIIFTPDDGGPVTHEPHTIFTHGETEVGAPPMVVGGPEEDGASAPSGAPPAAGAKLPPLLLDPLLTPGKPNGKYEVVPIQLQPADWHFPLSEGPISFEGEQTGQSGAMVPSNRLPPLSPGALHYVSPKKAGGVVVIRAGLPKDVKFGDYFQWKVTDAAGAQVPSSANGDQVSVPRDTPGQYTVAVVSNAPPTVPLRAQEITSMNVWIVWANVTTQEVVHPTPYYGIDTNPKTVSSSRAKWDYKAEILPPSICLKSDDIPDLTGKNPTPVPAIGQMHAIVGMRMPDANSKWNLTRQWREKVVTPLDGLGMHYYPVSSFYHEVPALVGKIMPTSDHTGPDGYPLDDVEGNDWGHVGASDPYDKLPIGTVIDSDGPVTGVHYNAGNISDVVEIHMQFREFLRLDIGDKWYRISDLDGDHNRTRFYLKFKKVNETMQGQDVDGDGQISGDVWQIMQLDAELNNLYF